MIMLIKKLFLASSDGTEQDTLEFALKIKCTNNKDSSKDSLRAEDMYKNNNGMHSEFLY